MITSQKPSLLIAFLLCAAIIKGQDPQYPAGFNQVALTQQIIDATAMAFAPDGRLFICQQGGIVKIFKNDSLLLEPFINIQVDYRGDAGLEGITFDPDFIHNKWVYLYYTLPTGRNNRIIKVKDKDDVADTGTIQIVLDLDTLNNSTIHNGGGMVFGKDDYLYVGVGENGVSSNAQNLDTYMGKILRITSNGSVPPDNPFGGSEHQKRIWSYGMRNPYTLTIDTITGKIYANDVGQGSAEEIDDITKPGLNFGWPLAEGFGNDSSLQNPVYAYDHTTTDSTGCCITGGVSFKPVATTYPAEYYGNYFFLDFCGEWINRLVFDGNKVTRYTFGKDISFANVIITCGPDGNLYFLSRDKSTLYRIEYPVMSAPSIIIQPQGQTVSLTNPVTFSVSVSGSLPISYQWYKNDTLITGATDASYSIASAAYADSGNYKVAVSNVYGNLISNNAKLFVTLPNDAPVADIITPLAGTLYHGGMAVQFNGSATDKEDGVLPDSVYDWEVVFHHNTHTHPGPSVPKHVKSGSFTIPDIGETSTNVYYRLYEYVHDSRDAYDTAYVDIYPEISSVKLQTEPEGMQLTLDGTPVVTPYDFESVAGIQRSIDAITPQYKDDTTWYYSRWSNSGNISQIIHADTINKVYTAYYKNKDSVSVPVGKEVWLYPLPVRSQVVVRTARQMNNAMLRVFDSKGSQVYKIFFSGTSTVINMSSFSDGIYFIEIKDAGQTIKTKLMVTH